MSDLGIGIVGMGWMGFIHADNSSKLRGARLVAVADLNEKRLAQAREQYKVTTYTDCRAMLEDRNVDLVIVVTPPHLHRCMVQESLAAGKHVLCEKPLGESLASMDEMVVAARQSDTKTMIGFLARFAISNQEVRLMIDEGELGEIEYVRANFRFTSSEHGTLHGAWVFDKTLGGGILLESSPHLWDLIRCFTGANYQEVFAYSRVDCILGNQTPSPSFEDGLKASEAAWAAEVSVRTGRPATVADVRQSLASLDELTWAKD